MARYRGFVATVRASALPGACLLAVRNPGRRVPVEYTAAASLDPSALVPAGLVARLDHLLAALDQELARTKAQVERWSTDLRTYTEQAAMPWEREQELAEKQYALARIERKLAGPDAAPEPDGADEPLARAA